MQQQWPSPNISGMLVTAETIQKVLLEVNSHGMDSISRVLKPCLAGVVMGNLRPNQFEGTTL